MATPAPKQVKMVVLMGGPKQGTRFRPLSHLHRPKPLFPIANAPMVFHQIEAAAKVPGMSEIIMLGSFKDDNKMLRSFAQQATVTFRLPVRYVEEAGDVSLGTAGGLYQNRDLILRGNPDAVFVIHCDVCCDFPFDEMMAFHAKVGGGRHMTIMSVAAKHGQAQAYGCIVADEAGLVQHYVEKPTTHISNDINCGVYLLSPAIFDDLKTAHLARMDNADIDTTAKNALSLERDIIIPLSSAGERVFLFRTKSFWSQIKTAASSIYANRHYLERLRTTTPALLATKDDGFTVVGDVRVDFTAEIDPTAKLGPNVAVGPGVRIGPGARVRDSIILANVELGAHCCILNTIIDRDAKIGEWTRVEGAPVTNNPNDPTTAVPIKPLFNAAGRLEPSITIVGEEVSIANEIVVLNSIVLPHKQLTQSQKNEIIL